MIIPGRFVGNVPFFPVVVCFEGRETLIQLLADTGSSRTVILDSDFDALRIPPEKLVPMAYPLTGIGGSVRSYVLPGAVLSFTSSNGAYGVQQNLAVIQHDLDVLSPEESERVLRLSSVLGRDIISSFRFVCDFPSGTVRLEQPYSNP